MLLILLRNPQKLIPKEELLNAVWGDAAVTENSLTRSIALLRRLLGDEARDPRFIETVATVGYRWVCKVEVEEESAGISEAAGETSANWSPGAAGGQPPTKIQEKASHEIRDWSAEEAEPQLGAEVAVFLRSGDRLRSGDFDLVRCTARCRRLV